MDDFEERLPRPLTGLSNLDDLMGDGDTSGKPFKVFIGHNLGNRIFVFTIPMYEFFSLSEVANERGDDDDDSLVAQRPLDENHAHSLAVYILKGLVSSAIQWKERGKKPKLSILETFRDRLGKQSYLSLQPIVVNIRDCGPEGRSIVGERMVVNGVETAAYKIILQQKDILWVVDGQHRRYGMQKVFEFLDEVTRSRKYPKKKSLYPHLGEIELTSEEIQGWQVCMEVARSFCTVTIEGHLGLGIEEERQLFYDLNSLGKKVQAALALQFDSSNPVNQYIKEVLIDDGDIGLEIIDKDKIDWDDDKGEMTRKDLVAINAILFLNKTNIRQAKPLEVEEKEEIATRFWKTIIQIPGFGKSGAKATTVAGQPVVLKALAKLTYQFGFSRSADPEILEKFLNEILTIDFSHSNPMWRYYDLTESERQQFNLSNLSSYLPSETEGANRDLGKYDKNAGVMRFGAKHNDISPIIGDMIRWKLGLPNRNEEKES